MILLTVVLLSVLLYCRSVLYECVIQTWHFSILVVAGLSMRLRAKSFETQRPARTVDVSSTMHLSRAVCMVLCDDFRSRPDECFMFCTPY